MCEVEAKSAITQENRESILPNIESRIQTRRAFYETV
jgi:hypothetical protein